MKAARTSPFCGLLVLRSEFRDGPALCVLRAISGSDTPWPTSRKMHTRDMVPYLTGAGSTAAASHWSSATLGRLHAPVEVCSAGSY
jgi:hypothetical protein